MPWLQLLRVALLPTLVWDVLAGAFLVGGPLDRTWGTCLLAALLVYHGGMIANDYCDRKIDAASRPHRPIPSGRVRPLSALFACIVMFGGAFWIAQSLPTAPKTVIQALILIVLLYNFAGQPLRSWLGPALLASARGSSLCLGGLASISFGEFFSSALLWPAVVYSLFFLFTSRLAAYEEEGIPKMRGISFLIVSGLTPLLLFNQPESHALSLLVWFLFSFWLLHPILKDNLIRWEPGRVQSTVRHSLTAAPLLHSIALVSVSAFPSAALGLVATLSVKSLAKYFPPE